MKNAWLFALAVFGLSIASAQTTTTSTGSVTTGSSSVVCVAGSFTNKDNVSTPTFHDYAHFSLLAGLGCSYWLDATLSSTASAGTYAGFHVRASNLLSLLSGLRVDTYLNGTPRESASAAGLLNAINSGEGDVYFQTTRTYNEVRLTMSGLASVAYELDIFYGFGLPTVPTGVVLPLSFTRFTAQRNAGSVALAWSFATNEHLQTMEVEKSLDGTSFNKIASIPATDQTGYSFLDEGNAAAYYRIRVVTDARSYYSRILHVGDFSNGLALTCTNPVTNELAIAVSAASTNRFLVQLSTLDGRDVYKNSLKLTDGTGTLRLPRNGLGAGLYLLRITASDGSSVVKKLVFN